jgi:hypothetical protein
MDGIFAVSLHGGVIEMQLNEREAGEHRGWSLRDCVAGGLFILAIWPG